MQEAKPFYTIRRAGFDATHVRGRGRINAQRRLMVRVMRISGIPTEKGSTRD